MTKFIVNNRTDSLKTDVNNKWSNCPLSLDDALHEFQIHVSVRILTIYSTGQTFEIKSHITCETSNVIYMIQCTKCNLQYIGETKRRLKDRFNEHRRPIINPFCSYTPTAVSRHFLTSGHAEDHMILIPLEHLHTSRDSIRKAREAFLIHRGKTLEPAGLNRRDEM